MFAHPHLGVTKSTRPSRNEITANAPVKLQHQGFIKRTAGEKFGGDILLNSEHALGQ